MAHPDDAAQLEMEHLIRYGTWEEHAPSGALPDELDEAPLAEEDDGAPADDGLADDASDHDGADDALPEEETILSFSDIEVIDVLEGVH